MLPIKLNRSIVEMYNGTLTYFCIRCKQEIVYYVANKAGVLERIESEKFTCQKCK